MKFLSFFLVFMAFGAVALAQSQEYPALFNVTDVPHGDVVLDVVIEHMDQRQHCVILW